MRALVCNFIALIFTSIFVIAFFSLRLQIQTSKTTSPQPLLVLFWTPYFGKNITLSEDAMCPSTPACKFTYDKSEFERADAVFFHAHDMRNVSYVPPNKTERVWPLSQLPSEPAHERQRFIFASIEALPSLDAASPVYWRHERKL